MEELRRLLEKYIDQDLEQLILSAPRKGQEEQKVRIRPVLLKGQLKFQAEIFRGVQAFHENMEKEELLNRILSWMEHTFCQLQLTGPSGSVTALVSKKGRVKMCIRDRYSNIIDTLEGKILVGSPDDYYNKGKVLIAAANPDLMEDYIEEGDLVILGNRYESQLCAIEMNAGCIIVCEGAKVSMTITKLAQEHGCVVISTPLDTFTAARLINQSMPIRYFMKSDNLTIFNVNEKTEDIREVMGQKRYRDFPIVDKDDNYVGMISRRNLLNLKRKQVIMVDHNEESQAVDGIEHAEILEIIDHHRLGSLETMAPVFFRNQPLGCTATIMYQMYQEKGVEIPRKIAGLLCAAIISDTLMFRSPTCTAVDKAAAEYLAQIAEVDIEDLAVDMFSAGSNLSARTADEIFFQDFKRFSVGNVEFGVGQINSMNAIELGEIREKIVPYISTALKESGLNMIFFMLTNIIRESTELLCCGANADVLVKEAFQLPEDTDAYELKGLVSRKKQLIPALVGMIQQMEEMR